MVMLSTNPESVASVQIFLSIGIVTFGLGVWQRRRELSPKHWLAVDGIVTKMNIIEQSTGDIYAKAVSVPKVEYEYRFSEQTFKSTHRCASNYVVGDRDSAEEVASRYQVGSSVRVLINPNKPGNSVLEYGATPLSWIPIGLGLLMTAVGMLPFFFK
jgi:hypothetical protein